MLLRGKKKFKVKWRAIRTTAIPKNPPMSEIHMLVRFRVLLPSAGSVPITPYFTARSADQKLGIFELGLGSGETDARSDGSVYTRSGLSWGANLTDFTGIESSGDLETRLGRDTEDFSIRISRVFVRLIFNSSFSL